MCHLQTEHQAGIAARVYRAEHLCRGDGVEEAREVPILQHAPPRIRGRLNQGQRSWSLTRPDHQRRSEVHLTRQRATERSCGTTDAQASVLVSISPRCSRRRVEFVTISRACSEGVPWRKREETA